MKRQSSGAKRLSSKPPGYFKYSITKPEFVRGTRGDVRATRRNADLRSPIYRVIDHGLAPVQYNGEKVTGVHKETGDKVELQRRCLQVVKQRDSLLKI